MQNNGQLTPQQAADLNQQTKAIQQAIECSNIGGMLGQTFPSLLPLPCLRAVKERIDMVGGRESNYVLEGGPVSLKFEIFSFKIL